MLPDKYEPGNHNLLGLAGLAAATEFLCTKTIHAIRSHDIELVTRLLEALREMDGVHVHGPPSPSNRNSTVSITVDGYDPQELAAILDANYQVQCRAGLQCAPRMHEALGTAATGGTLRISPGYATTIQQIDTVIGAVQEVASVAGTIRVP